MTLPNEVDYEYLVGTTPTGWGESSGLAVPRDRIVKVVVPEGVDGDFGVTGLLTLSRNDDSRQFAALRWVRLGEPTVHFLVPATLPTTTGPAEWDLEIDPFAQDPRTYPIWIDGEAAIIETLAGLDPFQPLAVPTRVVSERTAEVTVAGIVQAAQVVFIDDDPGTVVPVLGAGLEVSHIDELLCTVVRFQVPTVREFTEGSDIPASALGIRRRIGIRPSAQGAILPGPDPTWIVFPPPAIGGVERLDDGRLRIGVLDQPRPNDLGDLWSNEWLGEPEDGSVVFYRPPFPEVAFGVVMDRLGTELDEPAPGDAERAEPSPDTVEALEALRAAGTPGTDVEWREEEVLCTQPAGLGPDLVVTLWRGLLPSPPRLVPIDLRDTKTAQRMVRELFAPTPLDVTLPAGRALSFGVQPTGESNYLGQLIQVGQVTVTFRFAVRRDGSPTAAGFVPWAGDALSDDTSDELQPGQWRELLFEPPGVGRDGAVPTEDWDVVINAELEGIPLATAPIVVSLPVLTVHQLGLPLPELVVGFDGKDYDRDFNDAGWESWGAYVFIAPGSALGGQAPGLLDVTSRLGTLLGQARPLELAGFPSPGNALPDTAAVAALAKATAALDQHAVNGPVVVSTAAEEDNFFNQGDWAGFGNRIGSLIMVGPPEGSTLTLFEKTDQGEPGWFRPGGGASVALRMPAGHVVASYTTMWSWNTDTVAPGTPPDGVQLGNFTCSSRWT